MACEYRPLVGRLYAQAMTEKASSIFDFRPLGLGHIGQLRALEQEALAHLERPDLLRRNTEQMWHECLQPPHICLGAWVGDELAGFGVLYFPAKGGGEELARLLVGVDVEHCISANYKICIVHPRWRGHGLQVQIGERLAARAKERGIDLLCATASPYNMASVKSLLRLGYREDSRVEKYGFERILFYRIN